MKIISLVWKNFISTMTSHSKGYLSTDHVGSRSSDTNIHSLRDTKKGQVSKCNCYIPSKVNYVIYIFKSYSTSKVHNTKCCKQDHQ